MCSTWQLVFSTKPSPSLVFSFLQEQSHMQVNHRVVSARTRTTRRTPVMCLGWAAPGCFYNQGQKIYERASTFFSAAAAARQPAPTRAGPFRCFCVWGRVAVPDFCLQHLSVWHIFMHLSVGLLISFYFQGLRREKHKESAASLSFTVTFSNSYFKSIYENLLVVVPSRCIVFTEGYNLAAATSERTSGVFPCVDLICSRVGVISIKLFCTSSIFLCYISNLSI